MQQAVRSCRLLVPVSVRAFARLGLSWSGADGGGAHTGLRFFYAGYGQTIGNQARISRQYHGWQGAAWRQRVKAFST